LNGKKSLLMIMVRKKNTKKFQNGIPKPEFFHFIFYNSGEEVDEDLDDAVDVAFNSLLEKIKKKSKT
jgi:hypothetical protein